MGRSKQGHRGDSFPPRAVLAVVVIWKRAGVLASVALLRKPLEHWVLGWGSVPAQAAPATCLAVGGGVTCPRMERSAGDGDSVWRPSVFSLQGGYL